MKKKIGLITLAILLCTSFSSCLSMGGPGILFVEESHKEDWTRFYKIEPFGTNTVAEIISNVSLRGEISMVAINPDSKRNMIYWLKNTGEFLRSYEDSLKNVSAEQYFRNFKFPSGTKQIFVDWERGLSNDEWRKNHFVYFLDEFGSIWGINENTEKAERFYENVVVPIYATDIYLLFNNKEYPVMFVGMDKKPTRINARTGKEQIFIDVIIESKMIVDEIRGGIFEIEENVGLVNYSNGGQKVIFSTNILDFKKIIAPRIVNGVLYFGATDSEVVKTRGKAVL